MSRLSSSLSIAPFPPSDLRKTVPPAEWEACQEAWIAVADFLLSLSDEAFAFGGYARKSSPLVPFLVSYFRETSRAAAQDASLEGIGAVELRGKSYLLAHRALSEDGTISPDLLRWTFLADVSRVFPRSKSLPRLLTGLWARKGSELEVGFTKLKDSLIKDLDSKNFEASESAVVKLIPLLRTSPDVAAYVMTGSDLLDSLSAAYQTATSDQRESFVVFAFLGLVALTKTEKAQWPLLFDHLYALKSGAEAGRGQAQEHILPDLVSNTPILSVINVGKVPDSDKVRAENLVGTLSSFRGAQRMRPQKPRSRKPAKGKGRAQDDRDDVDEVDGMHAREMSLVSQIQDLFPNLGTGFVLKLLDAYDDDVERITAHLLDDSLPPELASSDRTQKRQRHHQHYIPSTSSPPPRQTHPRAPPKPHPTRPPNTLDILSIPPSSLHQGRRTTAPTATADALLADRSTAPSKAAILSALAAFDPDSDEHDDTYDVDEAGAAAPYPTLPEPESGSSDDEGGGGRRGGGVVLGLGRRRAGIGTADDGAGMSRATEEVLFRAYRSSREGFARDAATRRGEGRGALRRETGLTDEVIEGWAVMLGGSLDGR